MIESVQNIQMTLSHIAAPDVKPALIDLRDIKAILYLAIRGDISLPVEDHEVDILV